MENYEVLARRYRPTTFDEVVGQEPITRTLRNAIAAGRVAHAYLFCGTRGVGKTTVARILARALNCEKGPTAEPCGKCDICRAVHRGDDVDVLEIDGASNNLVEDVRVLRENAYYRPARARYKIYYIDEVHMLSRNAFNALLKTLEEPPEHVKFIFSTTEPERLPATILSRCQRFDFRAVPTERIAEHLERICKAEKVKADKAAVLAIAREGRGSVRDALTLLDQVIAVGDGKVALEAVRETIGAAGGERILAVIAACGAGETGKALQAFHELLASGADLRIVLEQLMRQVRDLMVVKTCGPEAELLDAFGPDRKVLAAEADRWSLPAMAAALGYLTEARSRARWAVDGRPMAELALVRMAALAEMEALPEVLAHLESIESRLASAPGRAAAVELARPRPAPSRPLASTAEKKKALAPAPDGDEVGESPGSAQGEVAPVPGEVPPFDQNLGNGSGPEPPPSAKRRIEEVSGDPLVQAALRLFEGRIAKVADGNNE